MSTLKTLIKIMNNVSNHRPGRANDDKQVSHFSFTGRSVLSGRQLPDQNQLFVYECYLLLSIGRIEII